MTQKTVSDEEILAAVDAAIDDGTTLQGGVTVAEIAERVDLSDSAAWKRLDALATQDEVQRGWGVPQDGPPYRVYRRNADED